MFDPILAPFLLRFGSIFASFSARLARPAASSKIAPLWYENLIFAYSQPCLDQLFLDFLLHGFVHAFGCYQGPFLEAIWAPKWKLFRTIFGKNAFKKHV